MTKNIQSEDIEMIRYQGKKNKMTAPYGGQCKIISREGNDCNFDAIKAPEYSNSVSNELIDLIKKANGLGDVQISQETQFSSISDHRPSNSSD
ncbi:hypothetical protein SARC_03334 [Sphaeroforma arctica JP610]|uniref:Uncharacterized protein n=1 Tax=Sphaeroforma arctica JP610 TaxID=667725 RepID=A0A0L0G860_9EUKA|nr:hypothetical protein SARC_03334 [Sphaeroforma arctica JP610]KNC84438.1 hypothetical protein SARC_03334 [Sphaeroforma arctica JP610]|eukprot:XP_014158340.1 hypothetical protein SARC_03334 [Sphaeroforma arctica JP610]